MTTLADLDGVAGNVNITEEDGDGTLHDLKDGVAAGAADPVPGSLERHA